MKGRHEGPVEIGRRRYGPDVTFLGVPRTGLGATGLDVVFIGAPYDGGTSHRPGPGWGRRLSAPRITCRTTRPRPYLALGVDTLAELRVADAWNVLMPPGETKESLRLQRPTCTRWR